MWTVSIYLFWSLLQRKSKKEKHIIEAICTMFTVVFEFSFKRYQVSAFWMYTMANNNLFIIISTADLLNEQKKSACFISLRSVYHLGFPSNQMTSSLYCMPYRIFIKSISLEISIVILICWLDRLSSGKVSIIIGFITSSLWDLKKQTRK